MNRWHVMVPALLGSLALVVLSDPPETAATVVAPTPSRAVPGPVAAGLVSAPAAEQVPLPELLDRRTLYPSSSLGDTGRDLFAGHSWALPPAPALADDMAAPVAPELPFAYIGKKREAGVWEVFLAKGDTTLILKEGQMAEQSYQVVRITPPTMTMLYLPMNHEYSVPIGEAE